MRCKNCNATATTFKTRMNSLIRNRFFLTKLSLPRAPAVVCTISLQKRSLCSSLLCEIVATPQFLFGAGIAAINIINVPEPQCDMPTARLVAFSLIKGGFYGVTLPFSLFGLALTSCMDNSFEHNMVPASKYCKHLNPYYHAENEKEKSRPH